MKATFQIPDQLYREVKAETAREGKTVREVTIGLFEQWLRQKKRSVEPNPAVDWLAFQPPLASRMPSGVTDHSIAAMRETISRQWNEPT